MKISLVLFALLALVGCNATTTKVVQEKSGPPPLTVDERIAGAAEVAVKALNEMAQVEVATSKKAAPVSNKVPPGLATKVNVNWSGPIDAFLKRTVELSTGYKLVVRGKEPAVPVIVTVDVKGVTLFELVRNAATQAGVRANVTVDASDAANRIVVLEYAV
ncbi:DotD/TraH family lipoprotein [Methylobacillus sp. Pita2]|uniref:DotD/TraH family lipoprotein n=1 Tax=Methylobacillus sp. Pita2 TaxID=3383245 RepID=UPI0038B57160